MAGDLLMPRQAGTALVFFSAQRKISCGETLFPHMAEMNSDDGDNNVFGHQKNAMMPLTENGGEPPRYVDEMRSQIFSFQSEPIGLI